MINVATSLKHLSDIELTKAIRNGLAYIDGDTVVPFVGGGAGYHNSDGSRFNAPDKASNANPVVNCGNGVKGSYTQVLAAASNVQDSDAFLALVNWPSAASTTLVDIGIGASLSEVVIAADLMCQSASVSASISFPYFLPIPIPSGTRIAARGLAQAASKTVGVTVYPIAASFLGMLELSRCTAYGAGVTAASRGTAVTASATVNAEGAYAPLTASTTNDIKAIIVAIGAQGIAHTTNDSWIDIAIGGAGSEVNIMTDLYQGLNSTATTPNNPTIYGPFPMDIKAGTRLSARMQSTVASTTYDVVVYGLD